MKLACSLTFCTLVLLVPTRLVSGADAYGKDINSPSANDPSASSRSQERDASPEEIADQKKQQEKAAADRDWMARGVEEYRARNSGSTDKSSLYDRLSSNKDLAKLAGITVPDSSPGEDAKAYRTGVTPGRASLTLRTDPSEKKMPGSTPFGSFKPLIQPMGFINKALPPFVQPPPLKSASSDSDTDLLDSPGMTAATKNPLLERSAADLKFDISTLDPLPNDSRMSGSAFSRGQLPPSSNADLLRVQPTAPGSTAKAQPTASLKPEKIELPEDLQPAKPIPFSPIRPPIADTHDILFR